MAIAAAPSFTTVPADVPSAVNVANHGAQSLLCATPPRPNYPAQFGAAIVYALLLGAVVTLSFKVTDATIEEQQVIELAPIPVDEPPEEPPPLEQPNVDDAPPPPLALDPIAPIETVKSKPVEKPRPRPEKKIEKKIDRSPAPRHDARPAPAAPRAVAPAARAPVAPPGASASAIANHFHACMQRAASNAYPESQAPRTARIGYHASFSASGSLTSYSISASGNGAFDAVANRLGGRCGSLPAPGKAVSLSGSLTFSP